jgi:uncharacterized protein RhaS with RHS repeats
LDWFEVRAYDSRIGRFTCIDPHSNKYPGLSPYVYCGNNPITFIDPTGMDSTIYLKETKPLNQEQREDVTKQVQSVLNQNNIPMKVVYRSINGKEIAFIAPDKTDVVIQIVGDDNTIIKKIKSEKDKDAEGYAPTGGGEGLATKDATDPKKRSSDNVVSSVGFGNIVAHEAVHAMGAEHTKTLMPHLMQAEQNKAMINDPRQTVLPGDRTIIMKYLTK